MPSNRSIKKNRPNPSHNIPVTHYCYGYPILLLAFIIHLLLASAITLNLLNYQFPGIYYVAPSIFIMSFGLLCIYAGLWLQFGQKSGIYDAGRYIIYYILILFLIGMATFAIQFTPFHTIDPLLLSFDKLLHFDLASTLEWTSKHPHMKTILAISYDTIPVQLISIPIFVILFRHFREAHEYFFLLLFCTLIGFLFYYFFPTLAPASLIESPFFYPEQKATGLKFMQIHHHIKPTTADGGMISFPSFHVIWAWLCLYVIRGFPWLFILLLPVNALLIMSCVLLGWHYLVDVIGSAAVILCAHGTYYKLYRPTKQDSPCWSDAPAMNEVAH